MAEYIVGIADDSVQDVDRLHREYAVNGTIVRCKDCKHWVPGYITDTDDFIPPRCLDNHGVGWSANDFCSYGVTKKEEDAKCSEN